MQGPYELRSRPTSDKKLVKLDNKGKPVEESASGSTEIKQLLTEFINSIDASVKKNFPITVTTDVKASNSVLKSHIKAYREQLAVVKESFLNYQLENDKINYTQKNKIIELEEEIVKLSAKIVHLESATGEPPKIQINDEVLREVYLNIEINDEQSAEEQLKEYKKLEENFSQFIYRQRQVRIQSLEEQDKKIIELNEHIKKLKQDVIELNKRKADNNEEEMNVEPKDAITAIPVFSGDLKDFESFVNSCDLYNQLITADNRPNLLLIIKAKIRGEALSKVSPMDEFDTWEKLKKQLREKIKKPVSYEYAQEDLTNVFQKHDESIDEYSRRVRSKLHKLNEASRQMANTAAEKQILQLTNEKLAISKFQQNIRDSTIRVLVSATAKTTLDEAIQIALQKEMMEKNKNIKSCTFCGMSNHTVENCRRKKSNNDQNKNKTARPNTLYIPKNYQNMNYNKNQQNASTSDGQFKNKNQTNENTGNNSRQKQEFNNSKGGNNKNVRATEQEESTSLQQVMDEENAESDSKN